MTLREFINANGGKLELGTLPGNNFATIKVGECYLAFAKKYNLNTESEVAQRLREAGADGLDVLTGTTSEGKTCHTIVNHLDSALKVFTF